MVALKDFNQTKIHFPGIIGSKGLKVKINLMKKASTSSVSGGTADGSRPRTLVGLGGQGSSEVIWKRMKLKRS